MYHFEYDVKIKHKRDLCLANGLWRVRWLSLWFLTVANQIICTVETYKRAEQLGQLLQPKDTVWTYWLHMVSFAVVAKEKHVLQGV